MYEDPLADAIRRINACCINADARITENHLDAARVSVDTGYDLVKVYESQE